MSSERFDEDQDRKLSRYLDGVMEDTEKIAFDAELDRDPELRDRLNEFEAVDILARGALSQVVEGRRDVRVAKGASFQRSTKRIASMQLAALLVLGLSIGATLEFSGVFDSDGTPSGLNSRIADGDSAGSRSLSNAAFPSSEASVTPVRHSPEVRPLTSERENSEGDLADVLNTDAQKNLESIIRDAVRDPGRGTVWKDRQLYGAVGEDDEIYLFEVERTRTRAQPVSTRRDF